MPETGGEAFVTRAEGIACKQSGLDITTAGDTGNLAVSGFTELAIDITVTNFSGTSVTFALKRVDAFGNLITLKSWTALTGNGTVSDSVGVGAPTSVSFGDLIRIAWTSSSVSAGVAAVSVKGK